MGRDRLDRRSVLRHAARGALAGAVLGLALGLVGAPGPQVLGGVLAVWGLIAGAVLGVVYALAVGSRRASADAVRPDARRRERRLPGPR